MEKIIDRVNFIIEQSRLSVHGFANSIGVAPSNFSKMLRGEATITQKTLHKISDTYGVSFEWLLKGHGEPPSTTITTIHQKASGDDITMGGNNSNNVTNSTELLTKAFDEIAAQRKMTEATHRLLETAYMDNRLLMNKMMELIDKIQ